MSGTYHNCLILFLVIFMKLKLALKNWHYAGPCRTEFSDVGFDFIVVGTNKI